MDRTSLSLTAFREPRGVMRILQLIFAIFAFATTTGFGGTISVSVQCPPRPPVTQEIKYGYPFALDGIKAQFTCPSPSAPALNVTASVELNGNFSSDAEFFVATGVLSLLYCLAIIGAYAFFDELYKNNTKLPMADFVFTVILGLLWISSSAAWANGLSSVKYVTDPTVVLNECTNAFGKVCAVSSGSYSTLNISIMLGFLNFFLWASDLWFLYKETPWFDNRQGGAPPV